MMAIRVVLAVLLLLAYQVCTARAARSLEEERLVGVAAWALAGGVVIAMFVEIAKAF